MAAKVGNSGTAHTSVVRRYSNARIPKTAAEIDKKVDHLCKRMGVDLGQAALAYDRKEYLRSLDNITAVLDKVGPLLDMIIRRQTDAMRKSR